MKQISALILVLLLSGCAAGSQEAGTAPAVNQTQSAQTSEEPSATSEPEELEETQDTAIQSEESAEAEEASVTQDSKPEATSAPQSPSPTATATKTAAPTATPTPTSTATTEPTETAVAGYTMAEVSKKNTAASCWVVVDGSVYDLTGWITRHPGGSSAITNLCGRDATANFDAQHGGQARPSSTLDSYYIGPLVG
jgi:cytochrome b involved in lipid metabolism